MQRDPLEFVQYLAKEDKALFLDFISSVSALDSGSRANAPPNTLPGVGPGESKKRAAAVTQKLSCSYPPCALESIPEKYREKDSAKTGIPPLLVYTMIDLVNAERICNTFNRQLAGDVIRRYSTVLRGDIANVFLQCSGSCPPAANMYQRILTEPSSGIEENVITSGVKAVWAINVCYWDNGVTDSDIWVQTVAIGGTIESDDNGLLPVYDKDPDHFKMVIKKLAPEAYERLNSHGEKEWVTFSAWLSSLGHVDPKTLLSFINSMGTVDPRGSFTEMMHQTCQRINENMRMCKQCRKAGIKFRCCGRCKRVYYCSTECQEIHWKAEHKKMCKK